MKNSREFKKECVRKDFNGLSEMLLGKNSAEQILGEDGIKLSNVAKAKVLAKRLQIIAEVLQQKTIPIPSQGSAEIILNDVVTLFYAEAFSKGAKDYSNGELLHYCIKTKAWNDAIQYARKIGGSAIDHETEIIEFLVDEISDENKFANVESNFDEWHRSILENAEKSGVKQDWGMNPGLWQKLINMSFKYDVKSGLSDVGISMCTSSSIHLTERLMKASNLEYSPICRLPMVAMVGVNHPLLKNGRKCVSLSELSKYPFASGEGNFEVSELLAILQSQKPKKNTIHISDKSAVDTLLYETDAYSLIPSGESCKVPIRRYNTDLVTTIPLPDTSRFFEIGWFKRREQVLSACCIDFISVLESMF